MYDSFYDYKQCIGVPEMLEYNLNSYKICTGIGTGSSKLNAFDSALISAGIANYNLVKISSILPPNSIEKELVTLSIGRLLPCAFAFQFSKAKGEKITAGVAIGIPEDFNEHNGVIMEISGIMSKKIAEEKLLKMINESFEIRNYKLKEVKVKVIENISDGNSCVFACVAIW